MAWTDLKGDKIAGRLKVWSKGEDRMLLSAEVIIRSAKVTLRGVMFSEKLTY